MSLENQGGGNRIHHHYRGTENLHHITTHRHKIGPFKEYPMFQDKSQTMVFCVKDLEALFPLRSTPIVVETPKASQVFDMNPKNCYTIGEVTKRFGITESSITLGMKWK